MEDIDWDHLPPTTAPSVPVSVRGFSDPDVARRLGEAVGEAVMTAGAFFDLSTLEGVTVGVDYDDVLASIDQGMEGLKPLSRTDNAEVQGAAKTCQVLRDGKVLSHIALNAGPVYALIEGEDAKPDDLRLAVGIIAHECGHVEINARMEALVPDARLGAKIDDFERAVLFQIADIVWDEYAVCRLTHRLSPRQNEQHAETIVTAVPGARARANAPIRAFRHHRNDYRVIGEAGAELCQPLKLAAYLLGGMDAAGLNWTDFPEARAAIESEGYAPLVDRMHAICGALWDEQDKWSPDKDVLAPLIDIGRDAFRDGGIVFVKDPFGAWRIHVPLTPQTMPE